MGHELPKGDQQAGGETLAEERTYSMNAAQAIGSLATAQVEQPQGSTNLIEIDPDDMDPMGG